MALWSRGVLSDDDEEDVWSGGVDRLPLFDLPDAPAVTLAPEWDHTVPTAADSLSADAFHCPKGPPPVTPNCAAGFVAPGGEPLGKRSYDEVTPSEWAHALDESDDDRQALGACDGARHVESDQEEEDDQRKMTALFPYVDLPCSQGPAGGNEAVAARTEQPLVCGSVIGDRDEREDSKQDGEGQISLVSDRYGRAPVPREEGENDQTITQDPDYEDLRDDDYEEEHQRCKRKPRRKRPRESRRGSRSVTRPTAKRRRKTRALSVATRLELMDQMKRVVSRCRCRGHFFYYYSVMPEKGKTIWVVFYCEKHHPLKDAFLVLRSPRRCMRVRPNSESWVTSARVTVGGVEKEMVQHKWCFNSPQETYPGESVTVALQLSADTIPLSAIAAHETLRRAGEVGKHGQEWEDYNDELPRSKDIVEVLLGPLSLVSTTSQRTDRWARIERDCVTTPRQLLDNCKTHPQERRHNRNGKGRGQEPRKRLEDCFICEEFDKAVVLPASNFLHGSTRRLRKNEPATFSLSFFSDLK